jgi:hypothetical protein
MITVCEGDSGAWVVHSAEPALYGHVVATDAFGDAYVIPAIDTLENIRKCLGAVSVQLPTGYTRPRNERGSRGPLTPKRLWSDCFSQDRGITGNYFLAQERSSAQFLDDIDHYTDHYTDYYTAFIVNEVKRFCEGANLDEPVLKDRVIQRRNAWLDDRSVTGGSRKYHSRLTAPQLYRALRERVGI